MSLLFSLHYAEGLYEIEYNHKKFCELNNLKYNKVFIPNSTAAKYAFILQQMQENIGKNIVFIDSNSYFNSFLFDLSIDKSIFVQKTDYTLDNFLFLNSNENSIKIIDSIYKKIKEKTFKEKIINNTFVADQIVEAEFPEDYYQKYPFAYKEIYTNLDFSMHENIMNVQNILVIHVKEKNKDQNCVYFANAFLKSKKFQWLSSDKNFDSINEGQKNALVLLYTKEIKHYAIAAEKNLTNYCKKNNLTLYVYREKPDGYENAAGSWCKPELLLRHINNHENIAWIDADILVTRNFKFDFSGEIGVYHDPSNWDFNSGYMWFKNSEKNRNLLKNVLQSIKNLSDISGVYSNGGDQKKFIEEVKREYPNLIVKSNFMVNAYPTYPIQINPQKHSAMIHFMGFAKNLRENVMKGYTELIEES